MRKANSAGKPLESIAPCTRIGSISPSSRKALALPLTNAYQVAVSQSLEQGEIAPS